jgi:hypothetical protein
MADVFWEERTDGRHPGEIKRKYDPDHGFGGNQNIKP